MLGSYVTMTTSDFRSDRARCAAIQRILDMNVFKQMLEAIFTDLELNEAHLLNMNLGNPTQNVEVRLQNQRKGASDVVNAMKMCCEPENAAPEMPEETYGAEQVQLSMSPWEPIET